MINFMQTFCTKFKPALTGPDPRRRPGRTPAAPRGAPRPGPPEAPVGWRGGPPNQTATTVHKQALRSRLGLPISLSRGIKAPLARRYRARSPRPAGDLRPASAAAAARTGSEFDVWAVGDQGSALDPDLGLRWCSRVPATWAKPRRNLARGQGSFVR
jgi:hypothetical protein